MKPPVIRVLAASGMYLRRRLESVCRQLAKQSGRFGGKHEIIDGYLLRAQKYNGRVKGLLMDLPVYLWFATSYREPDVPAIPSGLIAPVVVGRDLVDPDIAATPNPSSVTITARPLLHHILNPPAGGRGAFYTQLYSRLFEHSYGLLTFVVHSPTNTAWETSMDRETVALSCGCYAPVAAAHRVNFLEEDEYWEDGDSGWREDPREDNAFSAVNFYLHESEVHSNAGHRLYPKADSTPDNWGENANQDVRVWSTQLPLSVEDDGSALEFVAAFSTFVQASGLDPRGRACQIIARFRVEFEEDEVTSLFGFPYLLDPATSTNPAETPSVLTRTHASTSEEFDYHQLNYQAPTYMAKTGDTVSGVTRYAVLTSDDDTTPFHWHYTATIVNFDPTTGAATEYPLMTPDINDTSDGEDADWWYWAAVGIDSDGETAVYVGHFNWLVNSDPLEWDVRLGVAVVDEDQAFSIQVSDPGCYAFLGRLNASVHLNNPESAALSSAWGGLTMVSDGVTYIGNGKFIFPVSLTDPTEVVNSARWIDEALVPDPREFPLDMLIDFSVAQYALGDSDITVLSTVADGIEYGDAFSNPGRITVVQEEVADEQTDEIIQPAVLIASLGNGTSFSFGVLQGFGSTYISYDSGATWEQIADTGSGCGAFYVGSVGSGFDTSNILEQGSAV